MRTLSSVTRPRHSRLLRSIALATAVTAVTAASAVSSTPPANPPSLQPLSVEPTSAIHPARTHLPATPVRGALVSVTRVRTLSRRQVVAELTRAGFDPSQVRSGVRLYRL